MEIRERQKMGSYSSNASLDFGRPIYVDHVATKFPKLKIIAGHAGWPWINEMVAVAMRSKNIFIDISSFRPSYLAKAGTGWEMLLYFGSRVLQDQVVFGTEWSLLGFTLEGLIKEVRDLPLKEEVKEKWLYCNAARLFSLNL
ncbi:MAG: amidohydrolase family protein [Bacillota bacterium]